MAQNADDEQQLNRDEDGNIERAILEVDAPAPTSTEAFKASLERFKHIDDGGSKTYRKESPRTAVIGTRASSRKRSHAEVENEARTSSPSSSSSSAKRRRQPSRYAPPSKYAHLAELTDILAPNLICVFVGFNPGVATATAGHAYAHPSNLFWKLLHRSGCTATQLRPEEDGELPRRYAMGNTNIVARPSKDVGELSKAEMAAGTPILEEKVRRFRPEAVCIVGKGIWDAIWRWRHGREIRKPEFHYGWQDDAERIGRTKEWEGAHVFVATATSGLAASLKPPEKEAIWRPFGEWVKRRREERAALGDVGGEGQGSGS